ncbi:MAG: hypothetical protein ACOCU4_06105 [Alkalispirochaeta sp.]
MLTNAETSPNLIQTGMNPVEAMLAAVGPGITMVAAAFIESRYLVPGHA